MNLYFLKQTLNNKYDVCTFRKPAGSDDIFKITLFAQYVVGFGIHEIKFHFRWKNYFAINGIDHNKYCINFLSH